MNAIPTSDMPGHARLHERVYNALDRCQESNSVDFKESAAWMDLEWKLIRTIIAMGNLRDGGIIVIGASERGDAWDLAGISDTHLSTYNVDNILDAVNKYASPPIKIEIVLVKYSNDKNFLAIQVHEFTEKPFICRKNAPDNNKELCYGDIYVRTAAGKPSTKKVMSTEQMYDLLELAAEKTARRIIEVGYRIGLRPTETDTQRFDEELEGFMKDKIEIPVPVLKYPHWRVNFRPMEYKKESIATLGKCFEIIEKNKVSLRGWDYPNLSTQGTEQGQGNNWIASWTNLADNHVEYWRFYQSGQFIHLFIFEESINKEWKKKFESEHGEKVPGFIYTDTLICTVTEIYEFAARLCQSQVYSGNIEIKIELNDIKDFVLVPYKGHVKKDYATSSKILTNKKNYESDLLVAKSKEVSQEAIICFFEKFGWVKSIDLISNVQEELLTKRR